MASTSPLPRLVIRVHQSACHVLYYTNCVDAVYINTIRMTCNTHHPKYNSIVYYTERWNILCLAFCYVEKLYCMPCREVAILNTAVNNSTNHSIIIS